MPDSTPERSPAPAFSPGLPSPARRRRGFRGGARRTRLAAEVVVRWGDAVLSVRHHERPGALAVGDVWGDGAASALALPAERLGAERRLVCVLSPGCVSVVLAASGDAWLTLPGGERRSLEDAWRATARDAGAGGASERRLELRPGWRAHLGFGDLEVEVARVRLPRLRRLRRATWLRRPALGGLALALSMLLGAFGSWSLRAPPSPSSGDGRARRDRVALMKGYLDASVERGRRRLGDSAERAGALESRRVAGWRRRPWRSSAPGAASAPPVDSLERAASELAVSAPEIGDAFAPDDRAERTRRFGMVGALERAAPPPALAPPPPPPPPTAGVTPGAPLADDETLGDPPAGLALSGSGSGAGERGEDAPLGAVRSVGGGEGGGLEGVPAFGFLTGIEDPRLRQRVDEGPRGVSPADVALALRYPFDRVRLCYRWAVRANPRLSGRASARLAVDPNGRVAEVVIEPDATAPLPRSVLDCLTRAFRALSVPSPGPERVSVTYPIALPLP